jgi:hypothetical protein
VEDVELKELYGPPAKYSEHTLGDSVKFVGGRHKGEPHVCTGRILWLGMRFPELSCATYYVVEVDRVDRSPRVVFPSDIIEGG